MAAAAPAAGERVWVAAADTPEGAPAADDHEAPPYALGVVQAPRPDGPPSTGPGAVTVCLVDEAGGLSDEVVWVQGGALVPANPETLDGADDIGTLSHLNEPSVVQR
jgi:hypothetical protein